MLCLRGISSTNTHGSGGNGIGVLTSQSNIAVGSSGVTLPRDQTTLRNFINTARSLKIKLVRRKTPCLALEVEQVNSFIDFYLFILVVSKSNRKYYRLVLAGAREPFGILFQYILCLSDSGQILRTVLIQISM